MPSLAKASRALFGNDLILRTIGQNIGVHDRTLLLNLCLVSRAFHAAFSPRLYAYIEVLLVAADSPRFQIQEGLISSPHLHHARSLRCSNVDVVTFPDDDDLEAFQSQIARLLPRTPLLDFFEWTDLPLPSATFRTLAAHCPRLAALVIEYPLMEFSYLDLDPLEPDFYMGTVSDDNPFKIQDITPFAGQKLKALSIGGMYYDLGSWRRQLVTLLSMSPGLELLRLSIACDTAYRLEELNRPDEFTLFFIHVCNDFHDLRLDGATSALQLKSLHLGEGIYLWDKHSAGSSQYLSGRAALEGLTELASLEDVHIQNGGMYHFKDILLMYEGSDESGLEMDVFNGEDCPNLSRLSFYQRQPDVEAWWARVSPSFKEPLEVTFDDGEGGPLTNSGHGDGEEEQLDAENTKQATDAEDGEE